MTDTLEPPAIDADKHTASPVARDGQGGYQPTSRRPIADAFRRTARGAVALCLKLGVHPDVISYGSIVASLAAAACFFFSSAHPWLLIVAPAAMYLRLWLNMLDGMVALASGKASRRGEILNELPDRISDVLIFTGVAHSGLAHVTLGYWAAIFAVFTAYVGIFGQAVGARREFGGLMSKPWRMVALHIGAWTTFALLYLGQADRFSGRFIGLSALDWTCVVVILGCVQTIAVRLRNTMRLLRENDSVEPARRSVAYVDEPASRATTHTFTSHDGTELFYRASLPPSPTTKALVLLHRGHEHSGRWEETVESLGLSDVAIFAWDQRGHGRSPGERGGAESVAELTKDLDRFAKHLVATHCIDLRDTIVLAHSVGGVIAAAWADLYAPPLRGLVLATPALRVKLYVPLAIPFLRVKEKLLPGGHVKSYVNSRVLTHDPQQQREYDKDPHIFRQISVRLLLDLFDTSTRLLDDAGAITTPTLVLAAEKDWVVKRSAQWTFFQRLSSPTKQFEIFPGFYHAIFHEANRRLVVDRVRQFIDDCFARPRQDQSRLLDADRGGFTRTEYDRLRTPSANVKWPIIRGGLKTFCRLSDGIRLGWSSGFDSGMTLDYVYANRSRGTTPIGKLIDRIYLDSPGWRGIRQRRVNLETLLRRAIELTHADGRPARILDIASGPGRYVLETIASSSVAATAVLRDYQQSNLDAARALADQLKLNGQVEVARGDAFDRASLAAIKPKATIAIVSGLYELFPENEPLRRSLAGLAEALEPGGLLIYTCQPWHPQLEFIARALTNREGKPWIMRRRTQAEMDALVRAAGFEKVEQEIDRWGIFTVSLARRVHTVAGAMSC